METIAWTPGPWECAVDTGPEGFPLYCEVGTRAVTVARLNASEGSLGACEPNARLVAAAPDMAKALKAARGFFETQLDLDINVHIGSIFHDLSRAERRAEMLLQEGSLDAIADLEALLTLINEALAKAGTTP